MEDLWQETRVRNKIKWSCLSVLQNRLADEKSYKSLRKALDVIKHNKRHEKWEVVKPKPKENFEAPPPPESPAKNYESFSSVEYEPLTLQRQVEEEFEMKLKHDVFSLSGIRPVRKFPVNIHPILSPRNKKLSSASPNSYPQRMTAATVKKNPITPAQYEQMMRKSAIPVNRFRLSQIGEVISPNSDGWFSSKIETLRSVSDTAEVITPLSQFHHCLARNGWSVLTTMPRTQDGKVFVQIFSETEETTMVDLEHYTARLKDNYLTEEKKSLPTETIKAQPGAFFHKAVKSTFSLPPGWLFKTLNNNNTFRKYTSSIQFISPEGLVFNSFETVLAHLKEVTELFIRSPESATHIPRDASAMFRSLKIKSTTNQVSPKSKLKSLPGLSKAKSSTKKFSPPKCATPLKELIDQTYQHSPKTPKTKRFERPSPTLNKSNSASKSTESKWSHKKDYVKMVRSLPKKLPVKEIIAKNKEEEHQTSTRQKCSR